MCEISYKNSERLLRKLQKKTLGDTVLPHTVRVVLYYTLKFDFDATSL